MCDDGYLLIGADVDPASVGETAVLRTRKFFAESFAEAKGRHEAYIEADAENERLRGLLARMRVYFASVNNFPGAPFTEELATIDAELGGTDAKD